MSQVPDMFGNTSTPGPPPRIAEPTGYSFEFGPPAFNLGDRALPSLDSVDLFSEVTQNVTETPAIELVTAQNALDALDTNSFEDTADVDLEGAVEAAEATIAQAKEDADQVVSTRAANAAAKKAAAQVAAAEKAAAQAAAAQAQAAAAQAAATS